MSLFTDHIANTDDIVLQWYNVDEKRGIMQVKLPGAPKEIADEGDYYTPEAAWSDWLIDRIEYINWIYFHDEPIMKKVYKNTYMRYFMKEVAAGNFRIKSFHGVVYYNLRDINHFNEIHEIMTVWRFCKRNNMIFQKHIMTF